MLNGSNRKIFLFLGLVLILILALKITGRPIDVKTLVAVPIGTALILFGGSLMTRSTTKKK